MSLGFPRRAQAGVAAGLVLTFLGTASSPALADGVRTQEWWLHTLHVTRAWGSTKGTGVIVAVLDTGVDAKQADLTGSVITGPDYTHSGRTSGGAYWGLRGTAMATLIAGRGHGSGDASGIIGVAPAARILSVRVTLESNDPLLSSPAVAGGLPNAIARGIRYAVRNHAAVIDLPLDPVTTAGAAGSGGSPAERAAVEYALDQHVVLVAPAGDNGSGTDTLNYPAAYPGVISVGAFNEKFAKAPYSSRRGYVTLTAAGDGVTAASEPTGYALVHSTSAASAVVAGIVALIKAQFSKLTPAQVRQVLTTSTVFRPRGGRADGSGYGTVDAAAALMAASKLAEAVPTAAASAGAVATQAPPSAPAVPSTVIRKNLGHSLITDAGIAVAVFLVLLGCILGYTTGRRRRARSARLNEVRAATRVPARKSRQPDPAGGAGDAGAAGGGAPAAPNDVIAGSTTRSPGSNSMAGAGLSGAAMSGAGLAGTGVPGATVSGSGPSGAGFTGAGLSGTWRPVPAGAQDGGTPGAPGRATPQQPQVEPVGFIPAPLAPGADLPGFTPGGDPADPAQAGQAAGSPVPTGAPPWAPIKEDPSARFRGPGNAAIPQSAFPASAGRDGAEPSGEPGPADGGRAGRRAQGSHRANPARAPRVSGNPPWEPAPQPDSELPWAQAPAPPLRGGAALPQRQPTRPQVPEWEAIAEEAWPGGPRAARPHPPSAPEPDDGPQQADWPSYAAGPSGTPSGDAPPEADSGFLHGSRPIKLPQPPSRFGFLRGGRPAAAPQPPPSAGPRAGAVPPGAGAVPPGAGALPLGADALPARAVPPGSGGVPPAVPAAPPAMPPGAGLSGGSRAPRSAGPVGSGPAGGGLTGTGRADTGATGTGPTGAGSAGSAPKTGVPPWEITDSFLAIRAEAPGSGRGNGPSPVVPEAAGVPPEPTGSPLDSSSFPTTSPQSPDRLRGGGSFPAGQDEAFRFPGSGTPFATGPAEPPGLPRGGASFPTSPPESPGFRRLGGPPFPSSDEAPSLFRRSPSGPATPAEPSGFPSGGASFPTGPADPPGFPRGGTPFPSTPAGTPGSPGGATPADGTGDGNERTETFPAVPPPSGDGRLPRRIPLSERTGGNYPPPGAPRTTDNDAFRLFPFGKDTNPPPGQNSED